MGVKIIKKIKTNHINLSLFEPWIFKIVANLEINLNSIYK